jgi:hypothetical protein
MQIMVVDGQGGKIGSELIAEIIARKTGYSILAVGTNSQATARMLKAGADMGATGENPVIVNAPKADVITGPVGIIGANSLLGEITPAMAAAISESPADKVLIPMNRCRIRIAGGREMKLNEYIADAADIIEKISCP